LTTGIVFLNLGGPPTLRDVTPFLTRLFTDREIIRLPGGRAGQAFLGRAIALARTPSVRKNYARIGGGSPILRWTTAQAEGVVARLRAEGHAVEYAIAMRYAEPTSDDAVARLRAHGCDRVLTFTLYPHHSVATTGSSVNDFLRALSRAAWDVPVDRIDEWYDDPGYVDALAARVRAARAMLPAASAPTLLVSAHGLPEHFIRDGDRYCTHIAATIDGVRARVPEMPVALGYQSRVGPVRWIGPTTEQTIARLARDGVRDVVVLPVSFVSDHIEILYEIDMLYAEHARRAGIVRFVRTESLNDYPPFLDALARLARARLA
jgi:ferrochelatase